MIVALALELFHVLTVLPVLAAAGIETVGDAPHHEGNVLPFKLALIGVLGIGAQWIAWKRQLPAIVLMAIAGLIFGPLLGYLLGFNLPQGLAEWVAKFRLDPASDLGELYRPIIGLAVAVILFEGGLSLKFRDLRAFEGAGHAVSRMVLVAGPLAWVLGTVAAKFTLDLRWDLAAMIGGLFVVTGPTVVMPLLRQAHLQHRPAKILKWEGIVNDPVGALFAVVAFKYIAFSSSPDATALGVFGQLLFAAIFGTVMGIASGYVLSWAFRRGHIPEYLKAPIVIVWVILIYVLANMVGEETGLLAVTAMGMTMANTKYAGAVELLRFKEVIAVMLVSGVFVILTATLTPTVLEAMFTDWRPWAFVLAMMFLVRPIAVITSTLFSGITFKEALLVSWIAPRGVVAVAVAGLFATELQIYGRTDGAIFVPIAFALVFATVLSAGFTIKPVSKALGLAQGDGGEGVLIVGANPWSLGLAHGIREMGVSVLVADTNWRQLRNAKREGFETFYGEVLSEHAEYDLDHSLFNHVIATTPNDAYNSLVCVEFAPELGQHRVFQIPTEDVAGDERTLSTRGQVLGSRGRSYDQLIRDWWAGWRFRVTKLSDAYTLEQYLEDRGKTVDILMARKPEGALEIIRPGGLKHAEGATVLAFCQSLDRAQPRGKGAADDGYAGPKAALPK